MSPQAPKSLPYCMQVYLQSAACNQLTAKSFASYKSLVGSFHRWLALRSLVLTEVTQDHIDAFVIQPAERPVSEKTSHSYRRQLNLYLRWLHERGELAFVPTAPQGRTPLLPELAQLFLQTIEHDPNTRRNLRRFHNWCDENKLQVSDLRTQHIVGLFAESRKRPNHHAQAAAKQLAAYLCWLHTHNELRIAPRPLLPQQVRQALPPPLSKSAERFLRIPNHARLRTVLLSFHRWLHEQDIVISAVRADEVQTFFDNFKKQVGPRTGPTARRGLLAYLKWLHARDQIRFVPEGFDIIQRVTLPPLALEFLSSLEPTHRQGTRNGYRVSLHYFHDWLASRNIALHLLNRTHVAEWLVALHTRDLKPATRLHIIIDTRRYLHWLFEKGALRHEPSLFIRRGDLPKLPKYLPRPFQPDVDAALIKRLEASTDVEWRALWLIRHTGIRLGELLDLSSHCIRTDKAGHDFLKVPLGKLNNERLVPLSAKACEIIAWLQQQGEQPREYLFPRRMTRASHAINLRRALRAASKGLHDPEAIVPHRLRHTYATSLLAGGMSLVGVMKLLGHHDYRMTLRYCAITQDLVNREYFTALKVLEAKYALPDHVDTSAAFDPIKALTDIMAWLQAHQRDDHALNAQTIIRRLVRIQSKMAAIIAS